MNESEFCLQERGKAYVSSLKESRWPLEQVIGGASGSGLFVFLSVCIVHEPDAASVIVWGGPSDYKELSPDSSPLPPQPPEMSHSISQRNSWACPEGSFQ